MTTEDTRTLVQRLIAFAGELDRLGFEAEEGEETGEAPQISAQLHKHAMDLDGMVRELEANYVLADSEGDVPTNAQGIALARFLRPAMRGEARNAHATVAKGGFDLPDGYIHVRLADGYEGGIARDGRTST